MARVILSGSGRSSAVRPSQRGRTGLITRSIKPTNKITSAEAESGAADARGACNRDDESKNRPGSHIIHRGTGGGGAAERSSKMPRSFKMRTSTGKAVMLMLIPMKRAKATKEAPG